MEVGVGIGEETSNGGSPPAASLVGRKVALLNGFEKGKVGVVRKVDEGVLEVVDIEDARCFRRVWIDARDVRVVEDG